MRIAERSWTHPDRDVRYAGTGWSEPGEWHSEPDKAQWIDGGTQLDCLAVRNRLGSWCGYVGIPVGHPYYGLGPGEIAVEVHGSLTYAAPCEEGALPGHGICHIPEQGRPDNVWWLGFDCGHWNDLQPGMPLCRGMTLPDFGGVYRNLEYVRAMCAVLAIQLAVPE